MAEVIDDLLPYKFEDRDYQTPLFDAMDQGCRRAVCVWHRRSGKDKAAFNYMIKRANERVGAYFYFFPSYTQGKKVIWDGTDKEGFPFMSHIPKGFINGKPNETEMKVKLNNGSLIQIIGTDNINSVVGTNPIGAVFSEYSLQNTKAWDFIRPILAENGGWAIFLYTPRGMNHGWKLIQQAKANTFNAINNPSGWFWQILTVDDTRAISREAIEQERNEMPADLFEQEYYCKFIEGAGAFFRRIRENVDHDELVPTPGHRYQLGVDLAKYQDFTVLTPIDLFNFKVGRPERFNRTDWPFVKSRIEATAHKYNHAKVWVDQTGLGDPIVDDLSAAGLQVEGYKFTEVSRRQLLDNLQVLLSQDRIKLPNDEGLLAELQSMSFTLSETGKIKLQVPEGLHDDRIFSLALACWQLPPQPLSFYTRIEDGLEIVDQPHEYRSDAY